MQFYNETQFCHGLNEKKIYNSFSSLLKLSQIESLESLKQIIISLNIYLQYFIDHMQINTSFLNHTLKFRLRTSVQVGRLY